MTLDRIYRETFPSHDAVALNVDDTDFAGPEIDCSSARTFLLMYDLTEVGTLVDGDRLRLRIQFREPDGTWRDYQLGPFVALGEEESTTPCNVSVSGECAGEKMRLVATTDYTNADASANHFVLTSKITLRG